MHLVAVMDRATRFVLSWWLSNSMGTEFCLEALGDALRGGSAPRIFNTDQGSQFTSAAFTGTVQSAGVAVLMDGVGRWMDNRFIERLWRSLKCEVVHLHELDRRTGCPPGDQFLDGVPQRLPPAFVAGRAYAADGLRRGVHAVAQSGVRKHLTPPRKAAMVNLNGGQFQMQE